MARLFALGTLKRSFALHDHALCGATCLGRFRTCVPYPLVIAGPWFAPMLFDEPGAGHQIEGELYEVDAPRLARIDTLESIGKPGNLRILLAVEPLAGGPAVDAFAYAKSRELADPVHSGLLADYQDRRFIPPWSR